MTSPWAWEARSRNTLLDYRDQHVDRENARQVVAAIVWDLSVYNRTSS